jgi:hypothetical protein
MELDNRLGNGTETTGEQNEVERLKLREQAVKPGYFANR